MAKPSERIRGRFVLVGCGDAKADEPRQAQDLYTSSYFRCKRRYAEAATQWARTADRRANAWAVLSAEHHVLPARLEVEPYDTTLDDLRGNPIGGEPSYTLPSGESVDTELDKWALRVHTFLAEWLARPFQTDQEESSCRELVVLAGRSYVDALRNRGVFSGQPTAIRTGRATYKALPPRATVRFPFQQQDLGGLFEQQAWLADRADALEDEAAPARRSELSAFGAGYERDRARWRVNQPRMSVDGTEQAQLASFEDVPAEFIASNEVQAELSTVLSVETEAMGERTDV